MRLLFLIAAICCSVLVGAAAALYWSIHRERQPGDPAVPFAEAMRQATRRRPHPRMDLAAGVAAGSSAVQQQRVITPRRRGIQPEDAPIQAARLTNFADRPDRAYFNENMGDLSDPDLNRAPAGGVRRPTGTLGLPERR